MYRSTSIIVASSLILAAAGLSGCGKKSEADTNVAFGLSP